MADAEEQVRDELFKTAVLRGMPRVAHALRHDPCAQQYAMVIQNVTFWLRRAALLGGSGIATRLVARGDHTQTYDAAPSLTQTAAREWLDTLERCTRIDARRLDPTRTLASEYLLARQAVAVLARDWTTATLLRTIRALLGKALDHAPTTRPQVDASDDPVDQNVAAERSETLTALSKVAHALTHFTADTAAQRLLRVDPGVLRSGACLSAQPVVVGDDTQVTSYEALVANIRQASDATGMQSTARNDHRPMNAIHRVWTHVVGDLRPVQWGHSAVQAPLTALCALAHYLVARGYEYGQLTTAADPSREEQFAALAAHVAEATIHRSWPRLVFLVDVAKDAIYRVRDVTEARKRVIDDDGGETAKRTRRLPRPTGAKRPLPLVEPSPANKKQLTASPEHSDAPTEPDGDGMIILRRVV